MRTVNRKGKKSSSYIILILPIPSIILSLLRTIEHAMFDDFTVLPTSDIAPSRLVSWRLLQLRAAVLQRLRRTSPPRGVARFRQVSKFELKCVANLRVIEEIRLI